MSARHKYVRHSNLGFVVFPADTSLYHAHVGNIMRRHDPLGGEILSAGFVEFTPTPEGTKAVCFGRSESLDKDSLPDDSDALTKQLFD